MVRMFVRHEVEDFSRWKEGYDAFQSVREELGVRDAALFQGTPNPNEVTVWHDFDTLEAAQAFVAAPQLAAAMQEAGVTGEPQIWFADRDLPT